MKYLCYIFIEWKVIYKSTEKNLTFGTEGLLIKSMIFAWC